MSAFVGVLLAYSASVFEYIFPWDDGQMIQMTQRVIAGDLPHADFSDTYTGLLNYWHAQSVRFVPLSILSLRVQLIVCFATAIAFIWWCLRQEMTFRYASFACVAAIAWGPVVYAAPMPSWYNLILAMMSMFLLYRCYQSNHPSTLILIAGITAGLSICCKITGLYAVAAGLVFLSHAERSPTQTATWRSLGAFAGLHSTLIICLAALLWEFGDWEFGLLLGGPYIVLASLLFFRSWSTRMPFPSRDVFMFVLGAALPTLGFLLLFFIENEVAALLEGVFEKPTRRLEYEKTAGAFPVLPSVVLSAICGLAMFIGIRRPGLRVSLALFMSAAWLFCLLLAGVNLLAYSQFWGWLRFAPIVICIYTALTFLSRDEAMNSKLCPQTLLLFSSFVAFLPLIQLPFPHGIYVVYSAPLV
ncbi:MAG: hypothetical protein AAF387_22505, partial [Pseudomonadota bacterium]